MDMEIKSIQGRRNMPTDFNREGRNQFSNRLEMKRRLGRFKRWAAYTYEEVEPGKFNKAPYRQMPWIGDDGRPHGFASSNKPGSWLTYKKAAALARNMRKNGYPHAGVGVMLLGLDRLLVFDLDKVHGADGKHFPWVVEMLDLYRDHSHIYPTPSGNGYRIVTTVPPDTLPMHYDLNRMSENGQRSSHLEVYHNTARFITVLPGEGLIGDCPPEPLADLLAEIGADRKLREYTDQAENAPKLRKGVGGVFNLIHSAMWGTRDAMADGTAKPCRLSRNVCKRIKQSRNAIDRSGSWQSIVGQLYEEGYSKESTLALLDDINHPGLEKYAERGTDVVDRELERSARRSDANRARKAAEDLVRKSGNE